jgi:ankyrin repeat protein
MDLARHFFRKVEWPALSDNAHELLRACARNNSEKVRDLLKADVADVQPALNDALSLAARRGYTEIVRLLLDGGADGDALRGEARRWALEKGHSETAKLLQDWRSNHMAAKRSPRPPDLTR